MNNRWLAPTIGALAVLVLLLVVYLVVLLMGSGAPGQASIADKAVGEMADFTFDHRGEPVPQTPFETADGTQRTLGDFEGRVVLVNLWASWCAPCLTELPHLARLHTEMGGAAFQVVAVSLDREGRAKAQATLEKVDATALPLYVDASMALGQAFGEGVMPVTVLVDAKGREVGRYLGPADWASDEAKALMQAVIDAG
ncbi:thiol-disulfide isomerase/thioredoxin [Rhodothalassium salexigens DSM 2132]|uniref:Thiol-disulfide isomerase/thioredoxin n=1 Tax=Rhodothalassium salexigens DSM 2132 TaxID=1188247 RepID=A0A4R2PLG5_RHOSA|nr:TlpA disulfide reductase family protein [Rhodothalassium salexigens]MBB4210883.1 thiol-disulfide isomerase/thioredoxin [Rhodothalassium salexigens DSM 2132]MBK1638992.1 hypothetical protein [Rhodothalassium salexigens DSM 2132]TCP36459.1 thiol-disulfide isomerase/thioredoxin [Rhodothalassium salexigens DSM 2132]